MNTLTISPASIPRDASCASGIIENTMEGSWSGLTPGNNMRQKEFINAETDPREVNVFQCAVNNIFHPMVMKSLFVAPVARSGAR